MLAPDGGSRRHDRDPLRRPGVRAVRSAIRTMSRPEVHVGAGGGVDVAAAGGAVVEGLDPHAGGPEALDQRLAAVGDDPVQAQLGTGAADDPARGLGHPDLVGERLALEGDDDGPAGLLGVPFEHRPLRLAGPASVDRQVHGQRAAERRPRRRTAARSAGPAGARRPASRRSGSMSGTQPHVSPAEASSRSCGTNRSRPQSSAFAISASSRSTGVRVPVSCSRASSLPATAIT